MWVWVFLLILPGICLECYLTYKDFTQPLPPITVLKYVKEWSKKKQIAYIHVDGVVTEEEETVDVWEWKFQGKEQIMGLSFLQQKTLTDKPTYVGETEMLEYHLVEPYDRKNMQRVYESTSRLHFCLRFLRNSVMCALFIVLYPFSLLPFCYPTFALIIRTVDFWMGLPCFMIELFWHSIRGP